MTIGYVFQYIEKYYFIFHSYLTQNSLAIPENFSFWLADSTTNYENIHSLSPTFLYPCGRGIRR
jgi:hypothetical protein